MRGGGSYSVTSQVALDLCPKIFTSSSVVMPTRIGPGAVLWFLIETETHVGSFSGVETYSKTSSRGCSILMVFSTCIAHPPTQPPRFPAGRSASQMMPRAKPQTTENTREPHAPKCLESVMVSSPYAEPCIEPRYSDAFGRFEHPKPRPRTTYTAHRHKNATGPIRVITSGYRLCGGGGGQEFGPPGRL